MKIIFVNPLDNTENPPSIMPSEILSMAALGEERGYTVCILDANSLRQQLTYIEAFKKEIEDDDWKFVDLVFVNCNYGQYANIKPMLQMLRKHKPEILIGLHGKVPAALGIKVFDYFKKLIDFAIIGEPEYTFLEVCERINSQRFSEVDGLTFRGIDGKIHITRPRPLITDLSKLPLPDYTIFEGETMRNYFAGSPLMLSVATMGIQRRISISGERGSVKNDMFTGGYSRWDMVQTWGEEAVEKLNTETEGQPNFRFQTVDKFIEHIDFVRRRYAIDFVSILDEDFMVFPERVKEFCNKYMKADLHNYVPWGCFGDISNVEPLLLRKMKEAGCGYIAYKMRSDSQRMLTLSNTGATPEKNQFAIESSLENNIVFAIMLDIGSDDEDIDDIIKNIEFCNRFNFPYEPTIKNLQLGTQEFNEHIDCCLPKAYPSANSTEKQIEQYLMEYGKKPVSVVPNHEFTRVELLGIKELTRNKDIEQILVFAHETGREHSDEYIDKCPVCMDADE